jgi:serine/threonine protein phosphatase PrpC
MEDFLIYDEFRRIVAVFDGHEGEIVARTCRDTIMGIIRDEANMRLDHVLQYVQERVMNTMINYPLQGTTATVVRILSQNEIEIANVGDTSSILCCDENNNTIELSRDHLGRDVEERKRIERAGGYVNEEGRVEGRLMITRALGDLWGRHVGISSIPFYQVFTTNSNWEFLIVASDGVWDYVSFEMAKEIVRANGEGVEDDAMVLGRAVRARSRASGGRSDNMAIVVVRNNGGECVGYDLE